MRLILLWLIGGVTTALVVGLGLAALLPWLLHRRNLVHPRARADAPLAWLVSPAGLARLHRRLRRLVRHGRSLDPRGNEAARALIEALHLEAVRLDAELISARSLPASARRARTATLAARAGALEASASRLERLLRRPLLVLPDPVDGLDEALAGLDAAVVSEAARRLAPVPPTTSPTSEQPAGADEVVLEAAGEPAEATATGTQAPATTETAAARAPAGRPATAAAADMTPGASTGHAASAVGGSASRTARWRRAAGHGPSSRRRSKVRRLTNALVTARQTSARA
jgi:hypothetical protein